MTKKQTIEESQEFKEKKLLLNIENKNDETKHKMKMEELEYLRATNKIHHELDMERQRIRSAEIQRTIARKEQSRRYSGYNS